MRLCLKCGDEFKAAGWCCPDCDWQAQIIGGFPSLAPEFATAGGGFKPEYFDELAAIGSWELLVPQSQPVHHLGAATLFP